MSAVFFFAKVENTCKRLKQWMSQRNQLDNFQFGHRETSQFLAFRARVRLDMFFFLEKTPFFVVCMI